MSQTKTAELTVNIYLHSKLLSLDISPVSSRSDIAFFTLHTAVDKSCSSAAAAVDAPVEISVILPMYNGAPWLAECLQSVVDQDYSGSMELSVYDDSSTDNSVQIVHEWRDRLVQRGIKLTITTSKYHTPQGVGHAKNKAVMESQGNFLCFIDADDVMIKNRVSKQHTLAKLNLNAIVGCKFYRLPAGSTQRYTKWANNLSPNQLYTQMYTSHGPTIIMPTWFCARQVFDKVGGFSEAGKGTPEDLVFFYQHLRQGGTILRTDDVSLMYRYHVDSTTFSISKDTIWKIRIAEFQAIVLPKWSTFTIWNAGKQGRHFYRTLSEENKQKVVTFCDVDHKKIEKGFYTYQESHKTPKPQIPIVHFTQAKPPYVICVKLDLTGGEFEDNLNSLNLIEGVDYFLFS